MRAKAHPRLQRIHRNRAYIYLSFLVLDSPSESRGESLDSKQGPFPLRRRCFFDERFPRLPLFHLPGEKEFLLRLLDEFLDLSAVDLRLQGLQILAVGLDNLETLADDAGGRRPPPASCRGRAGSCRRASATPSRRRDAPADRSTPSTPSAPTARRKGKPYLLSLSFSLGFLRCFRVSL